MGRFETLVERSHIICQWWELFGENGRIAQYLGMADQERDKPSDVLGLFLVTSGQRVFEQDAYDVAKSAPFLSRDLAQPGAQLFR